MRVLGGYIHDKGGGGRALGAVRVGGGRRGLLGLLAWAAEWEDAAGHVGCGCGPAEHGVGWG